MSENAHWANVLMCDAEDEDTHEVADQTVAVISQGDSFVSESLASDVVEYSLNRTWGWPLGQKDKTPKARSNSLH